MRVLAAGLARDGGEPPEVLGVLLGHDELEVLLGEQVADAPAPFVPAPSGRAWRLAADAVLPDPPAGQDRPVAPLPALVTVGTVGASWLLINLEAAGLVALTGDQAAARALLAAMALELATSSWADFVDVVLVGFDGVPPSLERLRLAADLDEALPLVEAQSQEVARVLAETGVDSLLAGRLSGGPPDSWVPTVLLCAGPADPAALLRLTAQPGRAPVAAVVAGPGAPGRWTLELPSDPADAMPVPALGLDVTPVQLGEERYEAIVSLLDSFTPSPARHPTARPGPDDRLPLTDDASDRAEAGAAPERATGAGAAAEAGGAGDGAAASGAMEVRVLGRVEVAGLERVERGKSEELIVLLALHPSGIDGERLSEALWPGRPPAKATINTTTTVARGYLGTGEDGSLLLPHARNGVYRLHPSIRSDWDRFQRLVAQGDLHRALDLVRGRPFEGVRPRTYGWAITDLVPVMEAVIVDVADRLAERRLSAGDHAGAQAAARRGLAIAPYDERLYRKLMLAADAAGNPAGVEAVMEELLARLDDGDLEPYDGLHEATRELFERLRRSRPPRRQAR